MQHSDFVHLHVHTYYSLLDGACPIFKLAQKAHEMKMPALAMTDHGNLFAAIEFYETLSKIGIKPILGCEIYLMTEGSRQKKEGATSGGFLSHMTLLARNKEGYQNLCHMISRSYLDGFYYKPRIDKELLEAHGNGLIGLSGCMRGEIPTLLQQGHFDVACEKALYFSKIFGEGNFYLELTDQGLAAQKSLRESLKEVAKKTGLPLVATNDVHYVQKEHAEAQDALLCIQTGKTLDETNRLKLESQEFYLKSPEEMRELFADTPEAISNTIQIAEKCNVEFDFHTYHFPKFQAPDQKDLAVYLEEKAAEGLKNRWPDIVARSEGKTPNRNHYEQRLQKELKTIQEMGFSGYFLIVADFIQHSKSKNIPVGPGRGSAAGSLVAYCLEITDIDPLQYQLLFERFLNPERISMPDMDIDFCVRRRDEVLEYVGKKYGSVAQIITFGKMKARAVIRDVGRILGVPYGEVDRTAKLIPNTLNITLAQALEMEPRLKDLRNKEPRIRKLLEIAVLLEGFPRHASTHAAGVVISDQPLDHFLPLYKGQHDETVTQFDMKGVEKIGLIKFDFLGLKTLTVIDDTIRMLSRPLDLSRLPLNNLKVYEELGKGNTAGIFQLESQGMTDLVIRLKPNRFEDLIALVALFRPGPLGSGMVDDFIGRKHGRVEIKYELPELQPILEPTYGIILYQEQVMQIASALANFSLGDADILRRAMGKKKQEEMDTQREKFLTGSKTKKIPDAKAAKIFDLMAKFAEYGFNKCVVGETELVDAVSGEVFTVDDLVCEGPGRIVFSCDEKYKIVPRRVEAIISNGRKKVFLLETRLGHRIHATANHPFLTLDGWKNLGKLKIGDRVATPRLLPILGQKEWPEHEVISLAWLISEGNTCHPHSLYFYNNNISLIEDFAIHIEKFPFTKARRYQRKDKRWEVCANTGVRLLTNTRKKRGYPRRSGAFVWAQKMGLIGKKADKKLIPRELFGLSNQQLALFLGRLWSGDGFICGSNNTVPFYATASEKLASQVQHLLLRFGIVSRIAKKKFSYKGAIKQGFAVFITGEESGQIFVDLIGPHLIGRERQVARLRKYLSKSGAGRACRDTIPWEVKNWVANAKKVSGKTWMEIELETDLSMKEFYGGIHPLKKGFRRETIEKLGKYFYSERLVDIASSEVYWDEVKEICPEGIRETYDLTVEKNHNFIADGIVVHNSHSAAYALIAYQTAYFKVNHPTEYMAALLTSERGNTDKVLFYIQDCENHELAILPPDVNESASDFTVVGEKKIRFGLSAVKNVGEAAVAIILAARNEGPFVSLFDFCERVDTQKVNQRVIESLIKCGAFDFTKARRAALMLSLDQAMEMGSRTLKERQAGQTSLLDQLKSLGDRSSEGVLPDVEEWPEKQKLLFEKESLGFYLTGHPLAELQALVKQYTNTDSVEVHDLPENRTVQMAGTVRAMREITTRKGDRMAFVTLEDMKGSVEAVVFPDVYQKVRPKLQSDQPLLLIATIDAGEEENKLIAQDVLLLEEAPKLLTKSIHFRVQSHEVPKDQMELFRTLLVNHRGNCPAFLHVMIPNQAETVLKLPDDLRVAPTPQLVESVQKLFGHNITWFQA